MQPYLNLSGDSGVIAYEPHPDRILVVFDDGDTYLYSDISPGPGVVVQMNSIASGGFGLNTYINQSVRENYESKL